ncbi:MAG TPA: DNA-3-methyladenine glycosylase [Longilinea sp.]|nr:DNA-3-methyladenine glycosylase [Longilinea sp.]
MSKPILPASFYDREVVTVARELLGMRLVRTLDGVRISGIITEAEAYRGEEDWACHAHHGRTLRTAIMYGPPGHAYVYFTYGMHWMLNCVTGPEGFPAAVLLRAIQPLEGLEVIARRRPNVEKDQWCNGPAKICQALGLNKEQNGTNLCGKDGGLWIERGTAFPDERVISGPRVGLNTTPEPWLSMPWRFRVFDL